MRETRETERIKNVYDGYHKDSSVLRRWKDNDGNRLIRGERQELWRSLLSDNGLFPLAGRPVLEIGCGNGAELERLRAWGASPIDLHGVDLLPERVADAKQTYPHLDITCCNAETLPFNNETFDLVIMNVLMSSILDRAMRRNVAAEASRVLRANGAILWYDLRFNNPYNRNVRGMERSEVEQLFSGLHPILTTTTVLPPLTRRLGKVGILVYPFLRHIRFLRTHLIGLLIKR
jgi:SAM-dependent methyltransferase